MKETKQTKRRNRHKRIRTKIFGTSQKPRLCVFRSSNHIYTQVIDDEKNKIICSVNDVLGKKAKIKSTAKEGLSGKKLSAFTVGKLIAEKALEKKIEKVVFDRGGYKYHGRIKALADGAREGGLKF